MIDFDIDDEKFRSDKLPAKMQMKLIKRLAPIIGHVAAFQGRKMELPEMVQTLADALSKLSDDDLDYVVDACLAVTRKEVSGRWVEIYNKVAKKPMFEDMSLPTMMKIVQQVLGDNLGNFWPDRPLDLTGSGVV